MHVLGISCFYHDSAATLLREGQVVAAAQEERFSRLKHDAAFPESAIEYCLAEAGIGGADLDLVCFYEKPLQKFDRLLETAMATAPKGAWRFARTMPEWFTSRLRVEERFRALTGFIGEFVYATHHESHGASAFLASPFTNAAILTCDGVGEWATNTIGLGQGHQVEQRVELHFPHSLGLLYSAFTQYLGFRVNNGEFKVMGLAPYGRPRFAEQILASMVDLKEDGSYRLCLDFFDFLSGESMINDDFCRFFGSQPRSPEGPFSDLYHDVAASIQSVAEEILLRQARYARETTGSEKLCMAGGVALNGVANGRLLRSGIFEEIWIQPAASDSGGSLGAALIGWHHHLGKEREPRGFNPFVGPAFDEQTIAATLAEVGLAWERRSPIEDAVAALLAKGKVVGWFQDRMEFGPRALGGRSILADARLPDMKDRINDSIKFRESFRPFAPIALLHQVETYFELDRESPYMLLVVPTAEGASSPLPATTHIDGSARVQTVDEGAPFFGVLSAFDEQTGCPVLLNTSFNRRGEPIVCTPLDACRTFLGSGLDAMAIGPFLVLRPHEKLTVAPQAAQSRRASSVELRRFGAVTAVLFGNISALNALFGPWYLAALLALPAAVFGGLALFAPLWLVGVERVLSRAGRRVAVFNSTVLVMLIYLLLLTPMGIVRRRFADPLSLRSDKGATSYWRPTLDRGDYRRMY
ncbi:MAG: carbamoyltransferase [Proteobacteria bacterium]|nr:carbamoyltransferase [Pseudomonadota bacterium]